MSLKSTLTAIADKIRSYIGTNSKYKLEDMPSAIDNACTTFGDTRYTSGHNEGVENGKQEVYEEVAPLNAELENTLNGVDTGGKSYYDEFWEQFQNGGTRKTYSYAFRQSSIEYIRPKYKIAPSEIDGAQCIFRQCGKLRKIEADYVDFSQMPYGTYATGSLYYIFSECFYLEEVEDVGFSPCYMHTQTFAWCTRLRTIAKITVDENTQYSSTFLRCDKLKNLTIAGTIGRNGFSVHESPELTHDSLMSIINALKDNRGTSTWNTISFGAANLAKLTEDELFIMEQKQWEYS